MQHTAPCSRRSGRSIGWLYRRQEAAISRVQRQYGLDEPADIWLGVSLEAVCSVVELRDLCRRLGLSPIDVIRWTTEGIPALRFLPEDKQPAQEEDGVGAILAETALQVLKLPTRQAAAATLFYFYGQSYDQAASLLGLSAEAVQSALQRARDRLRNERSHIRDKAERREEKHVSDLEHVVEIPDLVLRDLSLGEHRWGMNPLTFKALNRGDQPLLLGLEVDVRIPDTPTGFTAHKTWAIPPGDQQAFERPYLIPHLYCPWFAVFRGPGAARIRVTFVRLSPEEHRTSFSVRDRDPATVIFQRMFEVIVPAEAGPDREPVKPILPKQGDVTVERVEPDIVSAEHDRLRVLLRNHTPQVRKVRFDLHGNDWGQERLIDLPASAETWSEIEYQAPASRPGRDERIHSAPQVVLEVQQLPVNFDALDTETPVRYYYHLYLQQVPEARIVRREFPLK